MSGLGAWALAYVERRRWAVLPCLPGRKEPHGQLVPHGAAQATLDPALVRAWWRAAPDANIGVALGPSALLVLDVDGPEAAAQLERLEAELGPLPAGLVVTTARGRHIYCRDPLGPLRSRLGELEARHGAHRYVLGAGSRHPTGAAYEIVDHHQVEPVTLPPAWVARLRPPTLHRDLANSIPTGDGIQPTGERALRPLVAFVKRAQEGNRNAALYWAACRLREDADDGRIDPHDGAQELLAAAVAGGLSAREAIATIASATGVRIPP